MLQGYVGVPLDYPKRKKSYHESSRRVEAARSLLVPFCGGIMT